MAGEGLWQLCGAARAVPRWLGWEGVSFFLPVASPSPNPLFPNPSFTLITAPPPTTAHCASSTTCTLRLLHYLHTAPPPLPAHCASSTTCSLSGDTRPATTSSSSACAFPYTSAPRHTAPHPTAHNASFFHQRTDTLHLLLLLLLVPTHCTFASSSLCLPTAPPPPPPPPPPPRTRSPHLLLLVPAHCTSFSLYSLTAPPSPCPCTYSLHLPPTRALTHSLPFVFSHPEFPSNPTTGSTNIEAEPHKAGLVIGCVAGGLALLVLLAVLLFVYLRRRQRTFKGDYNTKKHVFGNGYSKAGGVPAHPPLPKNLQYPEDSDDEKKPAQVIGQGGFEGRERDFDGETEDLKRPYFTVDEGESRDYDERTLAFQYDAEAEIADDMISQTDGSVISKKEWYV
ncbi:unnamed protein product [Arctogadus glacialis]